MQSNQIASPWDCIGCHSKTSHSEILNLISDQESKIREWMNQKPIESWPEIIPKLEDKLHPNHFLILKVKKEYISKLRTSRNIQILEEKMKFCEDLISILEKIDPGLTFQLAFILKHVAITRTELAKALRFSLADGERNPEIDRKCSNLAKKAMQEFRIASMCLKTPKDG